MIFPEKPRPPWQYAQPKIVSIHRAVESIKEKTKKESKPLSYYRDYFEFVAICIGFYFWVQYWIQFQ